MSMTHAGHDAISIAILVLSLYCAVLNGIGCLLAAELYVHVVDT